MAEQTYLWFVLRGRINPLNDKKVGDRYLMLTRCLMKRKIN